MIEQKDTKALARLNREVREDPVPDIDWAALEERLMERIPARSKARISWRWVAGLGVMASAAGALLWLESTPRLPPPATAVHTVDRPIDPMDGDRLRVGESLEASSSPLVVEHRGRATWTLLPGSRAHVAADGRFLTVALERGEISAEVVPAHGHESFAVEVENARIAAKGTAFVVSLLDEHARVIVTEGSVMVGLAGARGHTQGVSLAAPGAGAFTLNGVPLSESESDSSRSAVGALLPAPSGRPHPRPPLPLSSSLPEQDRARVELATDRVVEIVRGCFVRHTEADGEVSVSATTMLSVGFKGDTVVEVRFEPPLAPSVERCVRESAPSVEAHLTGSETMTREVLLSR